MIRIIILFLMTLTLLQANVFTAAKLRHANRLLNKGELASAQAVYQNLPRNAKLNFNQGVLAGLQQDWPKSQQYYELMLNDQNINNKEKAKAYLNLGNNALLQGDIAAAKKHYRSGLLLDAKNKKLKNNLEIANNAKLAQQANKKQQQQQQEQKKENNQQKNKTPEQQRAEKMLDAFKNKEQENMQQLLKNNPQPPKVEKDW